jgi:hypothetical protein
LLAFCASCASVPPGAVSVEARGGAHSAEVWGAIANAFFQGGVSSRYDGGSGYHESDEDWHTSLGLRAAVSTPVVDFIAGTDKHWFGGQEAREYSYGIRKRIPDEGTKGPGYFLLLARHGEDLRTDKGREDYDGVAVGIGAISPIDEHWFFDISLESEWLWNEVEIRGNDTYLFSMMLCVGIGFAL